MAKEEKKSEGGGIKKVATFIVDKRNLFFLLYVVALVFCLFSRNWVEVENDITTYLPDDTETRQGLTVMNDNFVTYGSARVMVTNVTAQRAQALADQIADLDGVSRVTFDTTEDHYRGTAALLDVSFDGTETDQVSLDAMKKINELLEPYDSYVDSTADNWTLEIFDANGDLIPSWWGFIAAQTDDSCMFLTRFDEPIEPETIRKLTFNGETVFER